MDAQEIYQKVNDRYGASARASSTSTGQYGKTVAQAFGYSAEELESIPKEANLGLSCGNPIALAGLKEGETVIDLGSGAGFDVFLAAKRVGERGRAIGVDMNDDMLAKANQNKSKTAASNVEFLKSQVTSIPLPPSTADVIISNCVINLVPDTEKPLVFAEMFRLLKPGGRVAVSDLLAKKDFPESVRNDVALYVGCIAGASKVEQYEGWLKEAGFGEVLVVDTGSDVNVYLQTDEEGNLVGGPCCGDGGEEEEARTRTKEEGCCGKGASEKKDGGCGKAAAEKKETCCSSGGGNDGGVMQDLKEKYKNMDLNEWVGSYKIYAVKPQA